MNTFTICLFSFNRGQFLENCVHSIQVCAPQCKLVIFDDNSTDSYTQGVLARLSKQYELVQPAKQVDGEGKFGGLYNNMQLAMDRFPQNEMLLFIQDDMQMVRSLTDEDFTACQIFFELNPKAAFLHPAFLRGGKRERDLKTTKWQEDSKTYYRDMAKQSAGVHFSAILITIPGRMRQVNWRLSNKEKFNDMTAKTAFGKMGFLLNPFCAWLPNVPVYRGKVKTLALVLAEKRCASGFYPFQMMSKERVQNLVQREPAELPIAEDFLDLEEGVAIPKPWIYYALEGRPLLKSLNRIELKLRKLFA